MNKNPTVFIGSSSEAIEIVEKLSTLLENNYNVLSWKSTFPINDSTLDSLMSTVLRVDYAIFIGAVDDVVEDVKRERGVKIKTRDNVLFEFGLFLSILGKKRCVYLADANANVMSDYNGITVPRYSKSNLDDSLTQCASEIEQHFKSAARSETNLFPSATLANVYYSNFIKLICNEFKAKGYLKTTDKKKYNTCEIAVVLPTSISDDVNLQFQTIKNRLSLKEKSIDKPGRGRKILIDVSSKNNHVKIVDFPTIITGIAYCIETLFPGLKKNDEKTYREILNRELSQFRDSLVYLDRLDPCDYVTIKFLDDSEILNEDMTRKKNIIAICFKRK